MYLSRGWGIFSSLWSLSLNWFVYIQTADQNNAGTDSSIFIKLFRDNGDISSEIKLNNMFRNYFKSGNSDKFGLRNNYLERFTQNTKLMDIEL